MRSGERTATARLLAALRWLPVDERVSRRAGELGRQYRRSHSLAVADLVIAATALELDAEPATANTRRFPMFCGSSGPTPERTRAIADRPPTYASPVAARPNPLLQPGAEAAWRRIEAQQHRVPARDSETIEQRLIRGQRLSAQAARLRRAVRDGRRGRTRP